MPGQSYMFWLGLIANPSCNCTYLEELKSLLFQTFRVKEKGTPSLLE